MKTRNQLLGTPGVKGVITVLRAGSNRGMSNPKFKIDTDDWPEWSVPHLRPAPAARLVILAADDGVVTPVLGQVHYEHV